MGWLLKNEITGKMAEYEMNDAVVFIPKMQKAILKGQTTIEMINDGEVINDIRPSMITHLPYLLNKEDVDKFLFRKTVTEKKEVWPVKGEVDYEKVNVKFLCEDAETIELIYL